MVHPGPYTSVEQISGSLKALKPGGTLQVFVDDAARMQTFNQRIFGQIENGADLVIRGENALPPDLKAFLHETNGGAGKTGGYKFDRYIKFTK